MEIVVLALLVLINGFFAMSEIALVSIKKNRILQRVEKGERRAKIVLDLIDNPENFLSSVQVGITLIGIIAGAYGGSTMAGDMEIILQKMPLLSEYAHPLSFIVVIGGITYLTILFGELVPKTIAIRNAETIAITCVPIIRYFTLAVYPFVYLLSFSTRIFVGNKKQAEDNVSEEDLRFLFRQASDQGVLEREEGRAHQSLLSFTDQTAESLMTHISKVEWVDINSSAEDVRQIVQKSTHSYFIVGNGSVEEMKGVLSAKVFLENFQQEDFLLQNILQEPLIIPSGALAFQVLTLFRQRRHYMGVVVDFHGTIKGVITLHDIMEAIVGDLPDEDEKTPLIIPRDEKGYLIEGRASVHEVNQYFEKEVIPDDPEKYTTIAGYLLCLLKKIPKTGAVSENESCSIEVVDMDGVRIDKLLLVLKESENKEKEG